MKPSDVVASVTIFLPFPTHYRKHWFVHYSLYKVEFHLKTRKKTKKPKISRVRGTFARHTLRNKGFLVRGSVRNTAVSFQSRNGEDPRFLEPIAFRSIVDNKNLDSLSKTYQET